MIEEVIKKSYLYQAAGNWSKSEADRGAQGLSEAIHSWMKENGYKTEAEFKAEDFELCPNKLHSAWASTVYWVENKNCPSCHGVGWTLKGEKP